MMDKDRQTANPQGAADGSENADVCATVKDKVTVNRPSPVNSIKACLALFRIRTMEAVQYRAAALASVSIGVFWALIELTVFTVFYTYAENREAATLNFSQILAYVWLGQALLPLLPNNIDDELRSKILNGDVGVELCRPLDLYFHWYAKSAAGKLGNFWWRGTITLAIGCAIPSAAMRLSPPASAFGFALFLLSLITLFLQSTSYVMLITSIRIGISWGEGPISMLMLLSGVLSGAYLPLPLWPRFMQGFLFIQPFAGQLDLPVRLYSGAIEPSGAAVVFALQIGWTLLFITAGRLIMRSKITRIIIQGG